MEMEELDIEFSKEFLFLCLGTVYFLVIVHHLIWNYISFS